MLFCLDASGAHINPTCCLPKTCMPTENLHACPMPTDDLPNSCPIPAY